MHYIDKKEFLRSFEVVPKKSFSIFLGAGSSAAAGIPTATDLNWEFKRKLYCDQFKMKEEKFRDLGSEINKQILQNYFNLQDGYPALGSKEEYSFYFEKCFPKEIHRKLFIQQKVDKIEPSIGFRCLAELFNIQKINNIWTTNFDELIERSLNIQRAVQYKLISPDNAHQVNDIGSAYPKVIKLHGDYRYDRLQNLKSETANLDEQIRKHLVEEGSNKGLIVVGYNGGDESVMNALRETLKADNPFPYGLIWTIRKNSNPSDAVKDLVQKASTKNGLSGFVVIDSFDEFLYELYSRSKITNSDIEQAASKLFEQRRPFALSQANPRLDIVKLNSIIVNEYPKTIYSFVTSLQSWKELREILDKNNIVATYYKRKTLAFGNIEDIRKAFEGKLKSEIELIDIESRWLRFDDNFFYGLLYDAIDKSVLRDYGLKKATPHSMVHRYYLENARIQDSRIQNHFEVYEAFEIQLQYINNSLYLLILPTVEVLDKRTVGLKPVPNSYIYQKQEVINYLISNRYNKQVNDKLKMWIDYLTRRQNPIKFQLGEFIIKLGSTYSFGGYRSKTSLNFFQSLAIYSEPKLQFNSSDINYKNTHPLKGLKRFGPYDKSLGNSTSTHTIKLGVIAPKKDFSKILKHLNDLNKSADPKSEKEYLIDYPGFNQLYKSILEFPRELDDRLCVVIDENEVNNLTLIQFYDLMKKKVDYFDTIRGDFDLLLVYFPKYWNEYRELKNDTSFFDLHDSLKIYAAKKNIKLQFVEDKSIEYFDKCRINWWLSLALYVKANGIPWKNQPIAEDTAYIGIGYAIKRSDTRQEVVIGCSQLFDSAGQGLRFLLQPLENPVYYNKNPYMSKEDARRLILKLKEAYFKVDPNSKLKKLVIHKTTPFTPEEIEGIAQGSDGISCVELLQIQQITLWRGLRSLTRNGKTDIHPFPIQRGTVLQIDPYSFLLWTHGSVMDNDIVANGLNYYQSKRGIPSPLLVRRFQGQDPIDEVAKSILNLTKMNWNGGQLYKILPVTLDFSKNLSRVAKQSEALQNYQYDFRYFM